MGTDVGERLERDMLCRGWQGSWDQMEVESKGWVTGNQGRVGTQVSERYLKWRN